jgi:integrase
VGVFKRADSRYWYLWLETAPTGQKTVRTDVLVGTRTQEPGTRKIAEQVYFTRMGALALDNHDLPRQKEATTFETFATWYDTHVVAHHRGKDREREILKSLRKTFGPFDLTRIDKAQVVEWRATRATQSSAATSNRELDVLKSLFAAAVPKYLKVSPIARLPRLRQARSETYVLSRANEKKLLKALPKLDRALVLCALDTLMRLSDVVNLRREQDRGTYLVVEDPKVKPYQVPVSKRLRRALDGLPKTGPYYFAHRRRAVKGRDYRSSVRDMLARACAVADIPYGRGKGLTFHGLRHTGTTRLVDAGVPLRIVQDLGGWQSMRQLERYAHPTEKAKRDAVELIGRLRSADEKSESRGHSGQK